ncbi:MAG: response regulator [Alphaproteobacteria bacterium]|nr:response regulator [Alphaproteobacteria bacterium]
MEKTATGKGAGGAPGGNEPPPSRSDGGVIAVVDDDDGFRESLGALIEAVGRQARLFASADAFVGALATSSFACVFLDVHMPGLSEVAAVAAVRRIAPDLRIVSVSGRMEPGDRERMVAAGAAAFLEKPLSFKDIEALIGA